MSFKKVAFLGTFTTDKADPEPKKVSVFQKKSGKKVSPAKWMAMSTLTCRDFSKDSYGYRDKNFILSDEGLTFELPPHLKEVYLRKNAFEKTEFRKLPLKPAKFRNEHKKTFRHMSESSLENITKVVRVQNT